MGAKLSTAPALTPVPAEGVAPKAMASASTAAPPLLPKPSLASTPTLDTKSAPDAAQSDAANKDTAKTLAKEGDAAAPASTVGKQGETGINRPVTDAALPAAGSPQAAMSAGSTGATRTADAQLKPALPPHSNASSASGQAAIPGPAQQVTPAAAATATPGATSKAPSAASASPSLGSPGAAAVKEQAQAIEGQRAPYTDSPAAKGLSQPNTSANAASRPTSAGAGAGPMYSQAGDNAPVLAQLTKP